MRRKRILAVFGTRPEAVKMCPVVKELQKRKELETLTAVTGQHREMLDQVLQVFSVKPDYDLSVMREGQTLSGLTSHILEGMQGVLKEAEPDVVLVHGDTTTAFAAALAAYYQKIPVGHVEAGLRTHDIYAPYPEEFNREAVSLLAAYHFAPTKRAEEHLLAEGKRPGTIYVTGNTVIDALKTTVRETYTHPELRWALEEGGESGKDKNKNKSESRSKRKLVLLTAHRRENQGEPMRRMFQAVRRAARENGEVRILYPVHPNPVVRREAEKAFAGCQNIRLIEPLDVVDFHNFMARSYMILTDSGGIQEEAPALGKPVLVMRDTTERPEGLEAGTLKLTGTSEEGIYREFTRVLRDRGAYEKMSRAVNPYGDGRASERIAKILAE